jgi:hypothetical protein
MIPWVTYKNHCVTLFQILGLPVLRTISLQEAVECQARPFHFVCVFFRIFFFKHWKEADTQGGHTAGELSI